MVMLVMIYFVFGADMIGLFNIKKQYFFRIFFGKNKLIYCIMCMKKIQNKKNMYFREVHLHVA